MNARKSGLIVGPIVVFGALTLGAVQWVQSGAALDPAQQKSKSATRSDSSSTFPPNM